MFRIILYMALSLLAAIGGAFLFYEYAFHVNFPIMIAGLFALVIGSVLFGLFTACLLFPKSIPVILTNKGKETYKLLKTVIGRKKRKVFYLVFILLAFTITTLSLGISIHYLELRGDKELRNYGKITKVRIIKISHNDGRNVWFVFEHNKELHRHSLHSNHLEVGDSVEVIYSTQKPDLIRWANDYQ